MGREEMNKEMGWVGLGCWVCILCTSDWFDVLSVIKYTFNCFYWLYTIIDWVAFEKNCVDHGLL